MEFRKLVKEMRACQKEYFRTRSNESLERSKALERQVDQEIRNQGQQSLFEPVEPKTDAAAFAASPSCYYCRKKFGIQEERYEVKLDDGKPPGTPHRWRKVGWACETCDFEQMKKK